MATGEPTLLLLGGGLPSGSIGETGNAPDRALGHHLVLQGLVAAKPALEGPGEQINRAGSDSREAMLA